MKKKYLAIILFILTFYALLTVFIPISKAQSSDYVFINGRVTCETTGKPIRNATISVWVDEEGSSWNWKWVTKDRTDTDGSFIIKVVGNLNYRAYAYYDDSTSPGFDYAPAYMDFLMPEDNYTLFFQLIPAASLILEGDLSFIESNSPSEYFVFTIIDEKHKLGDGYVYEYGTSPPCHGFLDLEQNHVIVPINRDITLNVNATMIVESSRIHRSFNISDFGLFDLKGEMIYYSLEPDLLKFNINSLTDYMQIPNQRLNDAEQKGFYVTLEKQDLVKARSLRDVAEIQLAKGEYDECYANLREAYLISVDTNKQLINIYSNAVTSTSIIIFFLALTAVAISFVIFEEQHKKGLAVIVLFVFFLTVLYFTYPGCKLISLISTLGFGVLSFSIAFLIALGLPYLLKGKIVSIFSMAKHNLKQRRLRSILTLTSVILLVISFISFTSFSTGYGLSTSQLFSLSPNPKGILLKYPVPHETQHFSAFLPINPSIIEWVRKKPEIISVAPKAENIPIFTNLGTLSTKENSAESVRIYGILGIQLNSKAEIIDNDRMVIQGKILSDYEENAVLISGNLAKRLDIKVEDKLTLNLWNLKREMRVAGLFDDHYLSTIKDVDGELLIPKKLEIHEDTGLVSLTSCKPTEVIITSWRFASEISCVFTSRIDVSLKDFQLAYELSRQIALEQDLGIWVSTGNEGYKTIVGSYVEAKGLSVLIPWIIVVLNVIIVMLNSIFERRREIFVLSAVGLNPSDIAGLFVTEAAIIGIVGSGIGYLCGLSGYRLMSFFSLIVEVRTKVSAIWSLAAVSVSLVAILVGVGISIKSSVIITPSLLRRWSSTEISPSLGEPWVFPMPLRVRKEDLDSLFNYVINRVLNYFKRMGISEDSGEIKHIEEEISEVHTKSIKFNYRLGRGILIGSFPFQLIASKGRNEKSYALRLYMSRGSKEATSKTASLIRMILIEWDAQIR